MSPLIPMVVEQTVHGERALDIYSRLLEKVSEDMERDYFMTAAEAIEYGLIDKVLARRFESDPRPAV